MRRMTIKGCRSVPWLTLRCFREHHATFRDPGPGRRVPRRTRTICGRRAITKTIKSDTCGRMEVTPRATWVLDPGTYSDCERISDRAVWRAPAYSHTARLAHLHERWAVVRLRRAPAHFGTARRCAIVSDCKSESADCERQEELRSESRADTDLSQLLPAESAQPGSKSASPAQ